MMSHTPKPWIRSGLGFQVLTDDSNFVICELQNPGNRQELRDNANLIAAAPDLLEALEALVNDYNDYAYLPPNANYDIAKQAIAKARGENGTS